MSEYEVNTTPVTEGPAQEGTYHYANPQYGTWQAAPAAPQPQKKEKKKRTGLKIVALALCFSLLGGVIGAGGLLAADYFLSKNNPAGTSFFFTGDRPLVNLEQVSVPTDTLMTASEVYAANVNSTVGITTSITTNYWGYQSTSAASGSGFILTEDGYILTNYHVVQNSNTITVSLYDGTQYEAKCLGYDTANDIAVLKVEAEGLSPVVLGDSDNLNVGDSVAAIGNPLGELTFSLTTGAISAKGRSVTFSNGVTMQLLQTDCAINSGNSGGALFNYYGEVVGITNAKYSASSYSEASIDNIAFAIPINDVKRIVESIIEKGYISKPYIGVKVSDVSKEAQQFGVPAGAALVEVTKGEPAYEAGLKVGDVITAVNGVAIKTADELIDLVGDGEPGGTLTLDVYRKGQTLQVKVTTREYIQAAD